MSSKIKSITLGCRFNYYESEVAKSIIRELGPEDDVVFINTCAVTAHAETKSKKAVRRAIRENPGAKILVSGCALKSDPEYFKNLEGVCALIPNDKKDIVASYCVLPHANDEKEMQSDFIHFRTDSQLFSTRHKVFLEIQNGCNNFCSYCIVPFARGRSRSIPPDVILQRVEYFVSQGFEEIVLSGINITDYGSDLKNISFVDVVQLILDRAPELKRLAISSMNPDGISDELIKLIGTERRIKPFIHLSQQSGSDAVLKHMRRNYSVADSERIIAKLRGLRGDIEFGADIIVGYPTETEENFQETVEFVRRIGFKKLHIFPYSPRPGTLAAQLIYDPKVGKERYNTLAGIVLK